MKEESVKRLFDVYRQSLENTKKIHDEYVEKYNKELHDSNNSDYDIALFADAFANLEFTQGIVTALEYVLENYAEMLRRNEKMQMVDLHGKCGGCKFLNYEVYSNNKAYFRCDCKDKKFRREGVSKFARYKSKINPACKKHYEERNDIPLEYAWRHKR